MGASEGQSERGEEAELDCRGSWYQEEVFRLVKQLNREDHQQQGPNPLQEWDGTSELEGHYISICESLRMNVFKIVMDGSYSL